jgi:protein gp37
MAQESKIQWTDATWNPWQGCKKVSEGCRACYMYRQKESYGQDPMTVVRSKDPTFLMLKKLDSPQRVFVCSWSDFFIEEADQWRADAWAEIRKYPQHTYIIPTKRPERITPCLPDDWATDVLYNYPNVQLLVSVEDTDTFLERVPKLSDVSCAFRGVSIEPLIAPIDTDVLAEALMQDQLDWVIVGGESGDVGSKYDPRPFPIENAIDIVKMCKSSAVPVFVKQMGTLYAKQYGFRDDKGGDFELFPKELQVREFPK